MLKCNPYNKNYLHQHLAGRAESEFTPLKTRSSPNEILLFLFGKSNFPRHNSSFNGSMWRRPRCWVSLQRSVSPQVWVCDSPARAKQKMGNNCYRTQKHREHKSKQSFPWNGNNSVLSSTGLPS